MQVLKGIIKNSKPDEYSARYIEVKFGLNCVVHSLSVSCERIRRINPTAWTRQLHVHYAASDNLSILRLVPTLTTSFIFPTSLRSLARVLEYSSSKTQHGPRDFNSSSPTAAIQSVHIKRRDHISHCRRGLQRDCWGHAAE